MAGDDCVCVYTAYVCKRLQLHDSARLFRGCGVVEPAVLSIDCYFESPADGTAVSPRDEAFRNLCHSQAGGAEGASGDTWHASSHCICLASEGLTATWHKQNRRRLA